MLHHRGVLVVVVVLAVLGVLAYDFVLTRLWVGSFPLEVRLLPRVDREVAQVWAGTLSRWEWAEDVRKDIRLVDSEFKPVGDFNGSSFTVDVKCTGRDSGLGLQRSYSQHQLLAIKFEFADGQSGFEIVEIPRGRGPRSVWVQVP